MLYLLFKNIESFKIIKKQKSFKKLIQLTI